MVVLILEVVLAAATLLQRQFKRSVLQSTDSFAFGSYLGLIPLVILPFGMSGTALAANVFLLTLFISLILLLAARYRPQPATDNPARLLYVITMGTVLFWLYQHQAQLAVAVFTILLLLNVGLFQRKTIWETMSGNKKLMYFFATGPLIGLLIGYIMFNTVSNLLYVPLGYFAAYLVASIQNSMLQLQREGGFLFFLLGAVYILLVFLRFGVVS